ncbi:Uncharacterised protein [Cedecea lapagei]|uniref:DNA binding HTH domain-containing protein n=1 Tax=Cedecea lapagei TaxID=158823 RepID=A0A3S4ME18_9ENTR|nr:Uncharacterised protein [Cedecea lapagei]
MDLMKRRGNQLTLGRSWKVSEIKQLATMAGNTHTKLIAKHLGRSYESVRKMAWREGISLRRN